MGILQPCGHVGLGKWSDDVSGIVGNTNIGSGSNTVESMFKWCIAGVVEEIFRCYYRYRFARLIFEIGKRCNIILAIDPIVVVVVVVIYEPCLRKDNR